MSHAVSSSTVSRGLVVVTALGICLLTVGCSASRTRAQSRSKVLEAENIDLNQQTAMLRNQMADAIGRQDVAVARAQELEYQKAQAERRIADADEVASAAEHRITAAERELNLAEQRAEEWRIHSELMAKKAAAAPVVTQAAPPVVAEPVWREGPELAALCTDLEGKMAANGIRGMDVEVRTSQDGTRRVAIVIPDAFDSGEATLIDNPEAVRAVVGLGRLVQDAYPSSRIMVEGHTDSDPLKRTKGRWGSNENLSLARADYVKQLLSDTGVPASQIAAAGVGARHPIEQGATKRAKSRNRRVEVFIDPR